MEILTEVKDEKEKQIIEDLATVTCEEFYKVYCKENYNV